VDGACGKDVDVARPILVAGQFERQLMVAGGDLKRCGCRAEELAVHVDFRASRLGTNGERSRSRAGRRVARQSVARVAEFPGVAGMARWQRLYHEFVAQDFRRRLYWRRLADSGISLRIGV